MGNGSRRRIGLSSRFVAHVLSGHSLLGLTAGALIYVLALSGTVAVFYAELERWENPGAPELETIEPAATARAAENVLAGLETVPRHFYVSQPVEGMPRVVISTDEASWFADSAGNIAGRAETGFTEFLLDLHYYLNLPGTLGLTVVGGLGVALVALLVSGLLSHPRLFRDAFTLRLRGQPRLREADIHNRLSVWASPFHFAIGLTGAALGLASVLALVIGNEFLDGDSARFFEPTFGPEPEPASAPAPVPDIERALANFSELEPDAQPWYVILHDPGTAGQRGEILATHARRLIYGENYYFDEHGEFTSHLGLADGPLGQQLVAGAYPVHFGSFGGLPVKLVYAVLGLLLCVVSASGIRIWLLRKRERGAAQPRIERAWAAVVWGVPAALALVATSEESGAVAGPALVALFWGTLVAAIALAALVGVPPERIAKIGRGTTGALVVAALVAQATANTAPFASPAALGIASALLAVALVLLASIRDGNGRRVAAQTLG